MKSFLDNFGARNQPVSGNKGWKIAGSNFIPVDTHDAFPENSIAVANLNFADARKLPADKQKFLRESTSFHEVHSATNLPRLIVALCADRNGEFAEPGQNWNPSDCVFDKRIPQSRLIWAVTDGDYYVVHFERGGMGHSFNLLVARLKAGESMASFIWRGVGWWHQGPLKDYSDLLGVMRSGKLEGSSDYGD